MICEKFEQPYGDKGAPEEDFQWTGTIYRGELPADKEFHNAWYLADENEYRDENDGAE